MIKVPEKLFLSNQQIKGAVSLKSSFSVKEKDA